MAISILVVITKEAVYIIDLPKDAVRGVIERFRLPKWLRAVLTSTENIDFIPRNFIKDVIK